METEVYYHYEFWELRYIRIWNKIFLSKGTVLDIINEFDFKLRFEGWDIEDEYTDHCKDCKMNSQYYWHIELWKIWAKVFFLSLTK